MRADAWPTLAETQNSKVRWIPQDKPAEQALPAAQVGVVEMMQAAQQQANAMMEMAKVLREKMAAGTQRPVWRCRQGDSTG